MPTKFKTSILIFGMIVMCLLACLATFLVLSASGMLFTEKAKVEITVQSATKVYDGTPLCAFEYQIEGELAEGHRESVSFSDSQTDAGESASGADVRILDEEGYDVTSQYTVKINKGLLRVTRQQINVAIPDAEVVYSGERVIFDDYILQKGTLAKGHKIGAESAVGVIRPGVVDTATLKPAVYDAFGNDVTRNYDLISAYGTVQIVPRPLVVRPRSESKVYDGKALFASQIEIVSGTLIAGHEIRATEFQTAGAETAQLTEAGKLPVYVKAYSIYDAKGENVSEYYKVTNDIGNPGILEVTPRELTVVGKSKSWEYDGKPHGFTSVAGREDTETSAEMAIGLADGHSVVINYDALRDGSDGGAYVNTITAVGSKPCYINGENVKVLDGARVDKSANYHITFINGVLTVTPQNLRITVKDYTVEYDEVAIPVETLKEQLVLFSPFTADDFELVMSETEYKNAGVYSLSAKPYVNEDPKTEEEIEAEARRKELFKNYTLDIVPGTVTISKKALDITVSSFTREYTGQEVSDETILSHVSFKGNFDKHNFEIDKDVDRIVNAGQYRISVKFKEGSGLGDDFDSDNYTLSIIPGTLTVTRKRVGVMIMNHTAEYSGEKVSEAELEKLIVCNEGFASSDFKITGAPEGGFVNVGPYVLGAEVLEDKADVREKLLNYEPEVTPGMLTITRKKVIVRVVNAEREYTQEQNAYADTLQGMLDCSDTALGKTPEERNKALRPVVQGEYQNAGTYIVSAELRDSVLETIKNNIELDVIVGNFTIRPKTVTLAMPNQSSVFSGAGITIDDITPPSSETDGILASQVKIISSTIEGVKNVGEYNYTAEMVILNESGNVSPNYTVRAQAGTWTITPLEISIQDGTTLSKVYDGKPIEIDGSKINLNFGSADFLPDDYSVISAEFDSEARSAYVGGELELKNIRIRDNRTGQECFNFTATGIINVAVSKCSLQISVGSITVKTGTTVEQINSMIMVGGVQYSLMGLAGGDTAVVSFVASDMGSGIKILPSIDEITDKFGESVLDMYDVDGLEGMGSVFFI